MNAVCYRSGWYTDGSPGRYGDALLAALSDDDLIGQDEAGWDDRNCYDRAGGVWVRVGVERGMVCRCLGWNACEGPRCGCCDETMAEPGGCGCNVCMRGGCLRCGRDSHGRHPNTCHPGWLLWGTLDD